MSSSSSFPPRIRSTIVTATPAAARRSPWRRTSQYVLLGGLVVPVDLEFLALARSVLDREELRPVLVMATTSPSSISCTRLVCGRKAAIEEARNISSPMPTTSGHRSQPRRASPGGRDDDDECEMPLELGVGLADRLDDRLVVALDPTSHDPRRRSRRKSRGRPRPVIPSARGGSRRSR